MVVVDQRETAGCCAAVEKFVVEGFDAG
jgi:hypothetical protein